VNRDLDPFRAFDPASQPEESGSAPIVHRLNWKADVPDPLLWLAAQPGAPKFYWRDRDGSREMACVGATLILSSDESGFEAAFLEKAGEIARQKIPDVRVYGGFRFDSAYPPERQDTRWYSLGSAWYVLPRFELVKDHVDSRMCCYLLKSEIGTPTQSLVASRLKALQFDVPEVDIRLPGIDERIDTPERAEWDQQVVQTLDLFRSTELKKMVLARRTSLRLKARVNPWHVLHRLRESADNCYLFGIQLADAGVWIGASPERLYRREGDKIETEALAGTRPRARNGQEDGHFARELTASDKDRFEHDLVVTGIRENLTKLCEHFSQDESTETMKLAAVQHLYTSFRGLLKPGIGDATILPALHPSAAVGGYPREQAVQQLRELEAFDRGWYAGPIGWVGATSAEFAVGIRTALIHDNFIDLFAGAGIVTGSSADTEWDEIENKMSPYLQLFGSEST
jgi:menaquinone-specific isochorismate synthase